MFHPGVKPLTVFPQYFPEYLLNVRNHSQKPLLVGGWLGKGMRETLPGCHFLFPRPSAPLVTWPVSAHPMGRITGLGVLVSSGRCWVLAAGAWDSFVTIQTRNNEFSDSFIP